MLTTLRTAKAGGRERTCSCPPVFSVKIRCYRPFFQKTSASAAQRITPIRKGIPSNSETLGGTLNPASIPCTNFP